MRPAVLIYALLAACNGDDAPARVPVDTRDPRTVARAALEAYRVKDVERLGALAVAKLREDAEQMRIQRSRHARYRAMFEGDRFDAVSAWDGALRDVRYLEAPGIPRQARVRFGEPENGRVPLVVLAWEDGAWRFAGVQIGRKDLFFGLPER